jgi:hypothetical protein
MDQPTVQENRLRKFASFFKGYMGVMPLVTAAVAPLLTMMKAIPVYESQKTTLATYSGLLGFLLLAWVFYTRGAFVRGMVPRSQSSADYGTPYLIKRMMQRFTVNLLPLLLIVGSVLCFIEYLRFLDLSVSTILQAAPASSGPMSRKDILDRIGQMGAIPEASALQSFYLGIFLLAEMAFVLMALREYAYGVLKISEEEILRGLVQPRPPTP